MDQIWAMDGPQSKTPTRWLASATALCRVGYENKPVTCRSYVIRLAQMALYVEFTHQIDLKPPSPLAD